MDVWARYLADGTINAGNITLPGSSEPMAAVMGIAQHHDAVSGTSKQAVAYGLYFLLFELDFVELLQLEC